MKLLMQVAVVVAVVALLSPAIVLAQTPAVGADAPNFTGTNWVLNAPADGDNVDTFKGDVVIISGTGVR